jgi:nitroimidazol reductase NimA-like FMN-containing flavoprotein (pyridoxamine 5'-phosphate oxidase superfamily)
LALALSATTQDHGGMIERTGLEVIDVTECWDLLATRSVGRLAVSVMNRPDIFPVNYRVVDGSLLLRTAAGMKLAAATLGTAIAFEVDELDEETHHGWSIVIHGTAHEVSGVEDRLQAEDAAVEPWADSQKDRFVRIDVDEITGRRIPDE